MSETVVLVNPAAGGGRAGRFNEILLVIGDQQDIQLNFDQLADN